VQKVVVGGRGKGIFPNQSSTRTREGEPCDGARNEWRKKRKGKKATSFILTGTKRGGKHEDFRFKMAEKNILPLPERKKSTPAKKGRREGGGSH